MAINAIEQHRFKINRSFSKGQSWRLLKFLVTFFIFNFSAYHRAHVVNSSSNSLSSSETTEDDGGTIVKDVVMTEDEFCEKISRFYVALKRDPSLANKWKTAALVRPDGSAAKWLELERRYLERVAAVFRKCKTRRPDLYEDVDAIERGEGGTKTTDVDDLVLLSSLSFVRNFANDPSDPKALAEILTAFDTNLG